MLETTRQVERATETALAARRAAPWLGGRPAGEARARLPYTVCHDRIGYVSHLDTGALNDLARAKDCDIRLRALPGTFVAPDTPLADLSIPDCEEAVRKAFAIEDARSFDQDPRFGLIVLAEIATRALSPGINDPGTAIDVIGRSLRLLCGWERPEPDQGGDKGEGRLFVPALDPADLLEDAYATIARDGAGMVEVQLRLQKALTTLAGADDAALADAARALSARALAHAREGLSQPDDIARIIAAMPDGVRPRSQARRPSGR